MFLFFLLTLFSSSWAFNVDTHNYIKHRGNPGSMFGFSVAAHRELSNSWVIVGAPEAQTSQPGVLKGGAVFRCDIARDDNCILIDFDLKGSNNNSNGKQLDTKSYQWFGATVRSSGEDGIILACAPRYIWYSTHLNRRDPVGTCYVAKNQFSEFAEYSPCRTRNWGYHRQGSCQAGLGASISRDGKRLYIGAVGSWYWQGQLHSVDALAYLPFLPPRYTIIEEGQVISQSSHARPDVLSTKEGPSADDDSYLGYSVSVGEFGGGSGTNNDVAVGMPRGAGLLGKVVLYSWNMTNLVNLTGEQLGAYFGYSLCTSDVDGDGRDDIIVGAPLYTDLNNNKGHYETGRVYIIYQGTRDYQFKQLHYRDGVNSKARFGLALSSVGDINLDGFGDFAVGAPYDGPKGKGAVYIYHGSARGVREKASQVVFAEQIVGQPTTFGFSLAGGLDLDENLYPDLVVGAYESDTAVFLRSRPVVQVESSLNFLSRTKEISLEEQNCTLRDRTKVTCVELNTCLKYNGKGVERRQEFEVQYVLDVNKARTPRLFFLSDEGKNIMNQTIRLDKGTQVCKKMFVYIKPNIRDKLTSLVAEMRYGLKGSHLSDTRRLARSLSPVLDLNEELYKKDSLLIQKNCGPDAVCIPDLRLIATPSVKQYLLGSGDHLAIDVLVQNEGEDAFEAVYELQVPTGLNYVNIDRQESAGRDITVLCSAPSYINNNTLHCDIGNPLPKEKIVHFKVLLQPYRLEGLKPRYEFFMSVNSTNPEEKGSTSDNTMHMAIPIWVETDLILQGSSQPVDVHYNLSQYSLENYTLVSQIGPQVNHVYSIRNKGPSDIIEAEAFFLWPSYTLSGDHLLYLLEQPEVSENVKCEYVEDVNVEKLNFERKKKVNYESGYGAGVHSSWTSAGSSSGSQGSSSWSHKESHHYEGGKVSEVGRESGGSWKQRHSGADGNKVTADYGDHGKRGGSGSATSGSSSKQYSWESEKSWRQEGGRNYGGEGEMTRGGWTHRGETSSEELHHRGQAGSSERGASGHVSHSGSSERGASGHVSHSGSSERGASGHVSHSGSRESSGRDFTNQENSGRTVTVEGSRAQGWTSSRERSESSASSHRQGGSSDHSRSSHGHTHIRPSQTHFEERTHERNKTWSSDRGPTETTRWTINRDGFIQSGGSESSTGVETLPENREGERYFGNRNTGLHKSWMETDAGRNRGSSHETFYGGSSHEHSSSRQPDSSNWRETDSSRNRGTVHENSYGGSSYEYTSSRPSGSGNWKEADTGRNRGSTHETSYGGSSREHSSSNRESSRHSGSGSWRDTDSGRNRGSSHETSYGGSTHEYSSTNRESSRHGQIDSDRGYSRGGGSSTSHSSYDKSNRGGTDGERNYNYDSEDTRRGSSGFVITEHDRNRGIDNSGVGSHRRNYTQETHSKNITWSSSGGPVITEYSSWRIDENGNIRNGSDSRVYGSADTKRGMKLNFTVDLPIEVQDIIHKYLIEGDKYYSEDRESTRNTTWSSQTGGTPETYESEHWSINEDGNVRNGSYFNTYRNKYGDKSQGSFGKSHGKDRLGAGETHIIQEFHGGPSDEHGKDRHIKTASDFHAERSESGSDESSHRSATNINIGDLLNSQKNNQGLDWGRVAQGPKDGKARTYTIDLGVLDSNNERKESKNSGHFESGNREFSRTSSGSREYEADSSREGKTDGGSTSRSSWKSSGKHYSFQSGGSSEDGSHTSSDRSGHRTGGFSARHNDDESSLDTHGRRQSSSSSSSRSWSYSSSSGTSDGDISGHGGLYSRRSEESDTTHHTRYRRETDEVRDLDGSLVCGPTKCSRIMCKVGPLKKDEEAFITFKSRVWVQTLKQLSSSSSVNVSSVLVARVSQLPHIGRPDVVATRTYEVFTQLVPRSPPAKPHVVPLWIVVLSACAGALLLIILVYLLYKCGFFKRNRPSNAPEKQPLNRNGHYQPGDEAL